MQNIAVSTKPGHIQIYIYSIITVTYLRRCYTDVCINRIVWIELTNYTCCSVESGAHALVEDFLTHLSLRLRGYLRKLQFAQITIHTNCCYWIPSYIYIYIYKEREREFTTVCVLSKSMQGGLAYICKNQKQCYIFTNVAILCFYWYKLQACSWEWIGIFIWNKMCTSTM